MTGFLRYKKERRQILRICRRFLFDEAAYGILPHSYGMKILRLGQRTSRAPSFLFLLALAQNRGDSGGRYASDGDQRADHPRKDPTLGI